jgi:glutamate-1-semialdehyde 2,1-aminomutase
LKTRGSEAYDCAGPRHGVFARCLTPPRHLRKAGPSAIAASPCHAGAALPRPSAHRTLFLGANDLSAGIPPARLTNFKRSNDLLERAHEIIPAGAHTYSKGADQFPQLSPHFIERGEGAHCWDVDGNEFVDWGMGLRAVILGHAYPRVLRAVETHLRLGANFTRPSPVELELAELLVATIPSAEMVKLAKNGSDVTSAAVRLARSFTGRDVIARCRESAFHSFYDWFIGSTVVNSGVPRAVSDLTVQFGFNDIEDLRALFGRHPGRIAAVIMEPAYGVPPQEGYLAQVRDLAHAQGAVLIFDEIITGFRWHLRGAQTLYGVTPDLSAFGKALGNGFSVAALTGRREIMRLGGIRQDGEKVFLLSSTHGGETHAIAASIATIREMEERDVITHLWRAGKELQDGFNALAVERGLADQLAMTGFPCYPTLVCRDREGRESLEYRTLFLQEMIAHGVLIPHVAVSYAHGPLELEWTLEAARRSMSVYHQAIETGSARPLLVGPVVKPVFRRYN